MTVEEGAAYLGLSPGTLRNWLSARRLPFVKVGRLTRLSRLALDRKASTVLSSMNLSRLALDRFIEDNTVEAFRP